jgi:hypothetical protein
MQAATVPTVVAITILQAEEEEAEALELMEHRVNQEQEAQAPTIPSLVQQYAMPAEEEAEDILDIALMEELPPAEEEQELHMVLEQAQLPIPAVAAELPQEELLLCQAVAAQALS